MAYEKLRSMIKQSMVQEQAKIYKEEKAGPYLPLSVHARNGLDEATLKRIENEAPMREHPLLGKTYQVLIESTSLTQSERRIVMLESSVKKRKKTAQEPVSGVEAAVAETADDAEEDFAELESEEEPYEPAAKRRKGKAKNPEETAAKKRAAAAEKAEKKTFQLQVTAAGKQRASVQTAREKLAKAWDAVKDTAVGRELPQASRENTVDTLETLAKVLKQIQRVLGMAAKNQDKLPEGEILEFWSEKDLVGFVKQANAAVKVIANYKKAGKKKNLDTDLIVEPRD